MKLAGRVAAAVEVLAEITARHRPASEALRDWGKAHRFAGSGDRNVIGTLVFDALRRRASAAALIGEETPRAIVLGTLRLVWAMSAPEIEHLCTEQFGPGVLSPEEKAALAAPPRADAPGDYPAWLEPELRQAFGAGLDAEMAALCQRAPIDVRVNTLKATRDQVLAALAKFNAATTPLSPLGLRMAAPTGEGKHINVEAEPAHGLGQFEVQDEASQLAALLTGVKPGETVLDLCAGAGGKSLALAALMHNQGTLVAHDRDKHRLRPIFERIGRSGASVITVVAADETGKLKRPGGYDLVVADAPCTGSGTWRRKPDAKWRLSEKQLALRLTEQKAVLDEAASHVRPDGRLAYFTCSVLTSENHRQVVDFLARHKDFKLIPYTEQWRTMLPSPPPLSAISADHVLQLTPARHNTDGFFVAIFRRG